MQTNPSNFISKQCLHFASCLETSPFPFGCYQMLTEDNSLFSLNFNFELIVTTENNHLVRAWYPTVIYVHANKQRNVKQGKPNLVGTDVWEWTKLSPPLLRLPPQVSQLGWGFRLQETVSPYLQTWGTNAQQQASTPMWPCGVLASP